MRALTRQRIIDAAVARFAESWIDQITLDEIAQRAGVTIQTVLRHFGTKEALLVAAGRQMTDAETARRSDARVADLDDVVSYLTEHYERHGDRVFRALAQEGRYPALAKFMKEGRHQHRTWIARAFGRHLEGRSSRDRERLLAQLVAICDVYTWTLFRRQAGLARAQTALAMRELLAAVLRKSLGNTSSSRAANVLLGNHVDGRSGFARAFFFARDGSHGYIRQLLQGECLQKCRRQLRRRLPRP